MKGTSLESPDKSKLFLCAVGTIPEQLGHCCCHLQNQEPRSRSSSGGTFSGSLLVLRAISLCIVLFPSVSGAVGTVVMKKEIHSIQPFPTTMCLTFKRSRIDNNCCWVLILLLVTWLNFWKVHESPWLQAIFRVSGSAHVLRLVHCLCQEVCCHGDQEGGFTVLNDESDFSALSPVWRGTQMSSTHSVEGCRENGRLDAKPWMITNWYWF